jgi:DnaJ-class molecular chaperone
LLNHTNFFYIYYFYKKFPPSLADKKGVYDIYGFDGLRAGINDKSGNLKGGYKYGGNSEQIFEKFFGSKNPFALIKDPDRFDDEYGTMFSSAFGGQYSKEKEPLRNVEVGLECTLEELCNGCVKKLNYQRKILNSDGRTTTLKDEEREIEIFKGYDKSIVLTFPGYGDEGAAQKNCKKIF